MCNNKKIICPDSSLISLFVGILSIIAWWKIFKKADKPGWASVIPFYNLYVMFQITWENGWKMLLLFIPIYNIYVIIRMNINLGKCFEKSDGFILGLIFLSPIFLLILGFDQSKYKPIYKK